MVKQIALIAFALALAVSPARAQDSTHIERVKPLERYESVIGSCLALSLVD